ncbi:MAG: hypothetical protein Aureis2KO_06430 [Aureisphaera sp.]
MANHQKYKNILEKLKSWGKLDDFLKTYGRGTISESKINEVYQKAKINNEEAEFLEALERILKKPLQKHLKTYTAPRTQKRNKKIIWILGIILLMGGLSWGAYAYLDSKNRIPGKVYEYHYALPNKLYLRDPKAKDVLLDSFTFGQRVKIKGIDTRTGFATVISNPKDFFGSKTGDASSFYLVSEEEFLIYNSLLSRGELDNISIDGSWMRKALISYYKSRGYIGGNFSEADLNRFGKTQDSLERWNFEGVQSSENKKGIFFKERLSTGEYDRSYRSVWRFGREIGITANINRTIDQFAAFILKNVDTGLQRIVIFEFDADQNGTVIHEQDLPEGKGDYVLKLIYKGFNHYKGFRKHVASHLGIACRSKNIAESEVLLFSWDLGAGEIIQTSHRIRAK